MCRNVSCAARNLDGCKLGNVTELPVRVLLVEDDAKLARLTREYLEREQLNVTHVGDGKSAVTTAARESFDVVLLDLMLPEQDGFSVCRAIRQFSHVPIIALTARIDVADRVLGLELGADDYITKPFVARELLARIRANVRRAQGKAGPGSHELRAGPLCLDLATFSATLDGKPLALTSYEFALLRAFTENVGRVLSREQLLDLAKGSTDEVFDRSIDVRISRLRAKLGDDPRNPVLLKTIRGAGYVLTTQQES